MPLLPTGAALRAGALAVALMLGLTASGCGSGAVEPPTRVGVSGHWVGELVSNASPSVSYPIELSLTDTRFEVTGSGRVEIRPDSTMEFAVVEGLFAFPTLSARLIYDRPPPGSLSLNVSSGQDFMRGSISGPGVINGIVEFRIELQRLTWEAHAVAPWLSQD